MSELYEKPVILLVEDDEDVREVLQEELGEEYCVFEAENGREALGMVEKTAPDLIVTDIMMPEMDGLELCRRLKSDELTSHVPVIMLTSRGSVENQLEGLETGADDYVSKPFHMPILAARIRNLLAARKQMRERFSGHELIVEPSEITVVSSDERLLQRAIGVVEEHLDDVDFNVEAFSSAMYMSRSTLYLKLKGLVGQTPQEFIRTLRLKCAAQLLIGSTDNMSEIAMRVGWLEPTHFSRAFKKQFGCSPSDYRNNHLER
ncbi:response regulator transcription factor [Tichowtungia aerotolerans]|uniref:Response regulator n=1 Tax=Tichowtungia aerotolerans TaxID=2697043 RepID=A0A6P1M1K5_9BACT|nr:response regulator [Tichowtungia aerotolerans]QHI67992.1 response regulator [Tichowtungia aerotolerans]